MTDDRAEGGGRVAGALSTLPVTRLLVLTIGIHPKGQSRVLMAI